MPGQRGWGWWRSEGGRRHCRLLGLSSLEGMLVIEVYGLDDLCRKAESRWIRIRKKEFGEQEAHEIREAIMHIY